MELELLRQPGMGDRLGQEHVLSLPLDKASAHGLGMGDRRGLRMGPEIQNSQNVIQLFSDYIPQIRDENQIESLLLSSKRKAEVLCFHHLSSVSYRGSTSKNRISFCKSD